MEREGGLRWHSLLSLEIEVLLLHLVNSIANHIQLGDLLADWRENGQCDSTRARGYKLVDLP